MNGPGVMNYPDETPEMRSVRSGSGFWADGRSRTPSSHAFTSRASHFMSYEDSEKGHSFKGRGSHRRHGYGNESGDYSLDDEDNGSEGTETPGRELDDSLMDDVGAQDAFIAGMIYALTRKIFPGLPYTPAWSGEEVSGSASDTFRWRLDECLKYSSSSVCVILFMRFFIGFRLSFLDGNHAEKHGIGQDLQMK